jgi:peptidyl-prolyl cis-trans isomerase SurA
MENQTLKLKLQMKRILLLCILAGNFSLLQAQTLFTYGNNAVTKDEFLRAYNKNKSATTDKEKALREYLDLYSKFKLKVKAAQEMQLDTLPQLTSDLQNFRSQIDETYLNNDNALNELIAEAFKHAQKDIRVVHFFTALAEKATAADSIKAITAMQQVYAGLVAGKKDYDLLAADISAKFTKVKASDIGYITAFSLPYEYEKIIYAVKNGEATKPYRSKNGLHVFKVIDERKAAGKWKVAQILLAIPPGDNNINEKLVLQKADSIYKVLQAGEDFAELAKKFSDDKLTYLSGGNLPEFTTGKYELPFETAVFKITKDGELSKPFATQFGYHIVKRISVQPVPATNDAVFMYDLRQKVMHDSRINDAKDIFTRSVIKQIGYKKNAAVKDADLFRYADSVVANPALNGSREFPVSNKVVFNGKLNNITGADWLSFIREYKTNPEIYKGETNEVLLAKLVTLKSMEYYRTHLEDFSPEFKNQMEEFKEGNLLFEIMERKVWSKAASDTAGLLQYYNQNKSKYQWAASADVIIFNCSSKKSAEETLATLKKGKEWRKIVADGNNTIQADSGRYELAQISFAPGVQAAAGLITAITVNETDGTAGFIKILKLHPAKQQRTFEEARGLVINDYQNILEEKWISELKNKYPVTVDESIFQSLVK